MKNRYKHTGHYISLILILSLGILGLSLAYPDRKMQTEIVILTALAYVAWGVFHHRVNHSLRSKIVIEYVLIAALGIAALIFFLTGILGI